MSVRYLRTLASFGESVPVTDITNVGNEMLEYNIKVIDLPGPTRNGIIYPLEEFKATMKRDRLLQQLATSSLYGEHNHPEDPTNFARWGDIDMNNTSFKWTDFWFKDNELHGRVRTVPINGDLMYKCIKAGELPSVSIRVVGEQSMSSSQQFVQIENIHLITVDWVRYPGNPDSFLKDASSFKIVDQNLFSSPEYAYKSFTATGESAFVQNGLVSAGESMVSLGNGLFAVSEKFDEEDYYNMKKFRLNSF